MLSISQQPVSQVIEDDFLARAGVTLWIRREDLIHPTVSGNKWRKLKYNLEEMNRLNKETVLTFGGAFSNHIFATAAAAREVGVRSVGVIRGERVLPLNPTLAFAERAGMQLKFIDREAYRQKDNPEFLKELLKEFGDCYLLPEGGTNALAVKGCREIVSGLENGYDMICCPVGTGGTMAGIVEEVENKCQVIGFSALKGNFITALVQSLIDPKNENWCVVEDYHLGGYAKFNQELIDFIIQFKSTSGIQLDPIYTGKMLFGIFDMVRKGQIADKSILAVHTGGLQGIAGFEQRYRVKIS